MPTSIPTLHDRSRKELTGRTVLIALLGFFAIVFTANGFLVHYALATLAGVDTPNAYKAGLAFETEIEAAARQQARSWQVAEHVERHGDGSVAIALRPIDAAGHAVTGLTVFGTLRHPADARRDRPVAFTEAAPGIYLASDTAPAGSWTLAVDLTKGGQRQFRSENRIVLP